MIDCKTTYVPFKGYIKTYNLKYKFRNMPYLVADKYGNFFILSNCQNKRTTNFKKLNSNGGYIYYNRNQVRLSTLRNRCYLQKSKIIL